MFAFYSNRLGCLGSLILSLVGSVIVFVILWLITSGSM
jgi:hypothetical protein